MAEEKTGDVEADEDRVDEEYGASRSDVDAMGNDKRRVVIGKQYGASVRKRLIIYGSAVGVVVVLAIVFFTVVSGYDSRERPLKDTAPWTDANASQEAPRDLDFLANGPTDTIPADQILNR